jgi:tetratricopeptide (TPR) repeat protein
MRLARLELVKEYGVSSVSWGSYLLYGDPNFVFFRKNPPALPLKARKGIFFKAGPLFRRAVFLAVLAVSVYILAHLPSIDPGTYVLFSKSRALFLKGDNDKSLELSRRIIERDPMFLPAYQLLADTFRRTGQRQNALKYYFAYLMHAGKKGDQKAMASAYNGIAWTYHLSGEYERAFEFYQQAISLSRKNRDPLNEAAAMEKLAVWYIDKGEYDQALELLTKSSEINRERIRMAEHRYNLACDYFDMGLIFVNKEDFSAAKSFYKKSQALFERMNLAHELSDCYFNLGEIYLYEKEYQQAMENYQRGLAIDRAQGNLLNFAGDYCMIGELYEEMGDLQKAEEYYEQGLQAAKKIESLPEMAWSYYDLGRLSKKQKKFSQAREYLRLAQALYLQMKLPDYELIRKELAGLYN